MSHSLVKIDAARSNRSLSASSSIGAGGGCRTLRPDPKLLFWRRLIDTAVAEAKHTYLGMPTDSAILARWWIEEHRPSEADREEWERSLDCACTWLGMDPKPERSRLIREVEKSLQRQNSAFIRAAVYFRRAMVLTCAGRPTAIARQHILGLVDIRDYEAIAGIDLGDQFVMYDQPSRR